MDEFLFIITIFMPLILFFLLKPIAQWYFGATAIRKDLEELKTEIQKLQNWHQ